MVSPDEKALYQKIASLQGGEIAKHFGCDYSGDGSPIPHGGFFYNIQDWEENDYADAVEFWMDPEHEGRLVVQRATIHRPTTPEQWESCWSCVGSKPGDENRKNIHFQIQSAQAAMGMETGDGSRSFILDNWQEWRIWRKVSDWLEELRES